MNRFLNITYATTFSANCTRKDSFLNIFFINIRSLRDRLYDLSYFVSNFPQELHVIVLNETRLTANDMHLYNLPSYISYHSVREKSGGGVSIFVLKKFSSSNEIYNFEYENSNFLVINLIDQDLKIGGFYKPPDSNTSSFLRKLDPILETNKNLICCGDFNLNLFSKKIEML